MSASGENLVPGVRVLVNGKTLPSRARADLLKVAVYEDVSAPDMFTIELLNWDMLHQTFTWSDSDLFSLGAGVSIAMGFGDDLETLIEGEVTGLEPDFDTEQNPTVTVRGYDRSHRLMRGRRTRSFKDMTDSAIAAEIASQAHLTSKVINSKLVNSCVLQPNLTDMQFLEQRAARIGFEVLVERGTLYFRPVNNDSTPVLRLERTDDIDTINLRLSGLVQDSALSVRGWDPVQKQAVDATANIYDLNSEMQGATAGPTAATLAFGDRPTTAVRASVANHAEAQAVADAAFNHMALGYITGQASSTGNPVVAAGRVVQIDGLGTRFSGAYYVSSTVHGYAPLRGYTTEFSLRRNAA